MDFKKADLNVNNVQKPMESFKKKEKLSNNVVPSGEEKEISKSPGDPKYWQSVAFGGNSQTQNGASYLEEAKKKLCSSFWRESDEMKERYSKGLEKVSVFGREAMDKYIECALYSANLYDSERTAHFDELMNFAFENYPKIKDLSANALCSLMNSMAHRETNYYQERKTFFEGFITDENYSAQDKADWFDYELEKFWRDKDSSHKFYAEPFEQKLDSIQTYLNYIGTAEDDETKKALNGFRFGTDDMKKYVALNNSGALPAKDFAELIKNIRVFHEGDKDHLLSAISNLYTKINEEGDTGYAEFFKNLTSKNLTGRPLPLEALDKYLAENDSFKREAIPALVQMAQTRDSAFCNDERDLGDLLDTLTKENFEDFKTCFEAEVQKPSFSKYYFCNDFINPANGHFDKKLYDAVQSYEAKLDKAGRKPNGWYGRRAADIIKAAVDLNTGEISPLAVKFMDKYFAGIEDNSPLNRLKSKKRYSFMQPMYKKSGEIEGQYVKILESLRDSNGVCNPINVKYMEKILQTYSSGFVYDFSFFDNLKDENGVVDKTKFKLAYNILEKTRDLNSVSKFTAAFETLGQDETLDALYCAEEILGSEQFAMRNFDGFVKHCWGDGEDKVQNALFAKEIVELTDGTINLSGLLFNAFNNEDNRNFAYELASNFDLCGQDINSIASLIGKYKNEDGALDDFIKDKIRKFADAGVSFVHFEELYDACVKNKENPEDGFMDAEFNKTAALFKINHSLAYEVKAGNLIEIINGSFSPANLKFKEKVTLLNTFIGLKKDPENSGFDLDLINKTIDMLDKSIGNDSIYLPVSDEVKTEFTQSVLGTSKVDEAGYTEFENVLKKSIPLLENMQKGLPLSYSREDFIDDLSELCDSEEKIQILKEKTGIIPVLKDGSDKPEIKGYEGIILLDNLDKNDEFQGKLYNLMHRFMYENRVQTYNPELDNELNKIIKACPEFINIIGKAQHSTHKYSLDIHSLLVLAYSINNPDYLNLNSTDKVMLKVATLFHDIAKQQDVVDNGHQEPSSLYARSIVKKFFNNEDSKDRVYELIRNHHWLAEFQTSGNKEAIAKETAYKFRRPNDFEIAKIMARADLMAVSEDFYKNHMDALEEKNIQPIQDMLDKLYATGCAAFVDYPDCEREFKGTVKTVNGRDFKVINFNEIDNNKDLFDYGFEYGKTKKDLNFLVHMVDGHKISESLRTVDMLTSSVNGGVLSESIITPQYKRTYCDRKYGVLLSQINANLVNMNNSNQGSGCEKDFNDITRLVYENYTGGARTNFRNGFLKELGLNPGDVSDKDFAEFYKNNIVAKTSLSQFDKEGEYHIGHKTFSGEEIINAVRKYQTSLIDVKEQGHNELVGYIPKIKGVVAKEKTIEEVPNELLDFAYNNNLPVILI